MLTLYLSPGFSSMAPHIALYEIGVGVRRGISFANREQYSPEYLRRGCTKSDHSIAGAATQYL